MDSYCVKETYVPSFSSTLLDSIYHSIEKVDEKMVLYNETMKKKNTTSYERACRVEKWMENQLGSKNEVLGKKPALDFERKRLRNDNAFFIKSSSSGSGSGSGCSDSSSGGGFSSSETESIRQVVKGSCYGLPKPKPVKKASISAAQTQTEKFNKYDERERRGLCDVQGKPKSENNFVKSKSLRAIKIYKDLKKVKQPISPGGRVTSFLNYIFSAGNTKNMSKNEMGSEITPKSANASTASSFSRSCLSNSRGKSSNGKIRTVRFSPVSVIVDEDCQPCGEKKLYDHNDDKVSSQFKPNVINEELKLLTMDKDRRRVDKAARGAPLAGKEFDMREFMMIRSSQEKFNQPNSNDEDEDEDESCASSDLFELDNLYAIGMDKYCVELPVYETTSVYSNTS